ncbi:MAG: glycosyltransferase family 4 protein [Myxococcales bacterium]
MLPRVVSRSRQDRARVLFINSPLSIGADTFVHLLLLRHLSRADFELHAAGQPPPSPSTSAPPFDALQAMSEVALRPTDFGPSLSGQNRAQKLKSAASMLPAAASMAGLVQYIREHRIQVLHSTDRPRDAIACAALGSLTGAKSVIHVHVKFDTWMSRGVQWALRHADAVVGVSRFVADSLVEGGHRPERVHALLNAIDLPRWDPNLSPAAGRASLGVSAEAPLIVSVARIYSSKGQAELIKALPQVKRAFPEVRLAIVGSDFPEGSGASRELLALARELGVADNVIFAGQRSDVPALLSASDVFALPSFEEPFGLVFAEALAMKRPVVALTNGGTPEVVEHGKSGLLSAPKDIDALAANLLTLLQDRELRMRMGEFGRRQVEARFGAERMAREAGELYTKLLA